MTTTISGFSLMPYDSSWKNLISPALDAGIPGLESLLLLLMAVYPLILAGTQRKMLPSTDP